MAHDAVGSRSTGLSYKRFWYNIEGIMSVLMKFFPVFWAVTPCRLGYSVSLRF